MKDSNYDWNFTDFSIMFLNAFAQMGLEPKYYNMDRTFMALSIDVLHKWFYVMMQLTVVKAQIIEKNMDIIGDFRFLRVIVAISNYCVWNIYFGRFLAKCLEYRVNRTETFLSRLLNSDALKRTDFQLSVFLSFEIVLNFDYCRLIFNSTFWRYFSPMAPLCACKKN